ncbi:uncharacterized protein LOC135075587 [Ostrinia nubilalis]|uniref:uncharacterized protein LOC135075587 n=1 Tax=Ostrinia nubilalis TaxID=29057 RepID=UPI003082632B
MTGYTLLKMEKISDVLKRKPRLSTCISFTLGMLAVTMSAIAMGVFIGYTYCYLEHHSGFKPVKGNFTQSSDYHILHMPYPESHEVKKNRTINGALLSSVLVSRILRLGQALVQDDQHGNMMLHFT